MSRNTHNKEDSRANDSNAWKHLSSSAQMRLTAEKKALAKLPKVAHFQPTQTNGCYTSPVRGPRAMLLMEMNAGHMKVVAAVAYLPLSQA